MRIVILIFSLFLFFSCKHRPHKDIDRVAVPYLNRFLELCSLYKVDCSSWREYSIVVEEFHPSFLDKIFNTFSLNTIGTCNHLKKKIAIKKQWLDVVLKYKMYEEIEGVMFHEFGHCILKKKHTKDKSYAIMSPTTLGVGYVYRYQKLMDEFFGCQKNCPLVRFEIERYWTE